jgi:hypothetical protein
MFIAAMTLGQLHAGSLGIDKVDSIDPKKARWL